MLNFRVVPSWTSSAVNCNNCKPPLSHSFLLTRASFVLIAIYVAVTSTPQGNIFTQPPPQHETWFVPVRLPFNLGRIQKKKKKKKKKKKRNRRKVNAYLPVGTVYK
ncbi:hypothetical protein PgNI_10448, partial [Pyricularia grisea]|uniref:Uncharacterized protein n=1 Tax=Pyricularia grisea TaxID=148305 RepID=A0A6P8AY96_PYRGI